QGPVLAPGIGEGAGHADPEDRGPVPSETINQQLPTCCALSHDGRLALCGDFDGNLWLWDTVEGGIPHLLEGHQECVHVCGFAGAGRLAASGSADKTQWLWDVARGTSVHVFGGKGSPVRGCALSFDGTLALLAHRGTPRLWNTERDERITRWT